MEQALFVLLVLLIQALRVLLVQVVLVRTVIQRAVEAALVVSLLVDTVQPGEVHDRENGDEVPEGAEGDEEHQEMAVVVRRRAFAVGCPCEAEDMASEWVACLDVQQEQVQLQWLVAWGDLGLVACQEGYLMSHKFPI